MASSDVPDRLKIVSHGRWDDAHGLFILKIDGGEDAPPAVGMTKVAAQITLDLPFATVSQCIAAMDTRRSAVEDRINAALRDAARAKSAGIVFLTEADMAAW
ncbi:MAG: hypothetical protein ABWY00_04215 [Dongiaceae bacterium]